MCSRDERGSGWNWVEIPIVLWGWGWERAPLADDAPCSSHFSLHLRLGFADAILGKGRPLASSEETGETLSAGAAWVFWRMRKGCRVRRELC